MNKAIEIFGWYGTIAILGAYFLNTFGVITPTSNIYLWLNITGALGEMAVGYKDKMWQGVTLNLVWLLIGVVAVIKVLI